jgi:hypothetical protein
MRVRFDFDLLEIMLFGALGACILASGLLEALISDKEPLPEEPAPTPKAEED